MEIGFVTTTGQNVCLDCANMPNLYAYSVGVPHEPIEDPSPAGVRNHDAKNADRYDSPCAVCGWSIRRSGGDDDGVDWSRGPAWANGGRL